MLDTHLDALDAVTAGLRHLDDHHGGGAVLGPARAQLRHVATLLRDGRYSATVGRRLHATAAELLRLTGWAAFDADRHGLAQRYWLAGLRCAHAAGDHQLSAHIVGFMSQQAGAYGDAGAATSLAEAANRRPVTSRRLTAILRMRRAQAHAVAGDAAGCRADAEAAGEALRSRTFGDPDPDWTYWLDEETWHEMTGHAFLHLCDWSQAEQHLIASLADRTRSREVAARFALLAQVHARRDEPDRAVALAGEAIDLLAGGVDSPSVDARVRQTVDLLAPHAARPAVRDLSERLAVLGT